MSDLARGVGVVMDIGAARRLSERIRLTAHSARENLARLQVLVQEAQAGQAHVVLGYASWTAYLADVFGEEPLRLPRDQRQELVGYLAGEGMSTRAIAPIVGVSKAQVATDAQVSRTGHLTPDAASPEPETFECDSCHGDFGMDRRNHTATGLFLCHECSQAHSVDTETGEVFESPEPPRPVTGLDGKTYTRPEPRPALTPPRATPRRALVDDARDAGQELRKVTERLQRLASDDRLTRNKDEVAAHLRHHLEQALQVCQDLSGLIT